MNTSIFPGSTPITAENLGSIEFDRVIYCEISSLGAMGNEGGILVYLLDSEGGLATYETNASVDGASYAAAVKQILQRGDLFTYHYGGMGNDVYVRKDAQLEADEENVCFWYHSRGAKLRIESSVAGVFLGVAAEMQSTSEPSGKNRLRGLAKNLLTGLFLLLLLSYLIYKAFFVVTDEVGYLGADKYGRQIFIQSFELLVGPHVKVDSEFNDRPVLVRVVGGILGILPESPRTTMRLHIEDGLQLQATTESSREFLSISYEPFLSAGSSFELQEGWRQTGEQIKTVLRENGAKTLGDFLAGMGFRKFEVCDGEKCASIDLAGVKNVLHAGNL